MKKSIRVLMCIFLALSSITVLYSQKSGKKIKISGSVLDAAATPVVDAIITIDGEKTNIITDSKGFYKIKVSPESKKIGVFTSTSGTIEADIAGRNKIDFTFTISVPYNGAKEEPVDIGYGKVKTKDLSGPVGHIDGRKSKYAGYNTIYDLIRGHVPGVQVSGTTIMIRSASSITESVEPLFVVDGVPVSTIENIIPQEVRSIEVLKGSAASIYGSRGSNGVIVINLLKGTDK